MMNPFTWGAGGQQVSPEQAQIAQALAAPDISPVAHPMQGFSRIADAGVNNFRQQPTNYFPPQPGGNSFKGGLTGLASRMFGTGGGLY